MLRNPGQKWKGEGNLFLWDKSECFVVNPEDLLPSIVDPEGLVPT
jgi:hypothetical protein